MSACLQLLHGEQHLDWSQVIVSDFVGIINKANPRWRYPKVFRDVDAFGVESQFGEFVVVGDVVLGVVFSTDCLYEFRYSFLTKEICDCVLVTAGQRVGVSFGFIDSLGTTCILRTGDGIALREVSHREECSSCQ